MKKETLINALDKLPNNFNLDELFEKLIVLEKIESGREAVRKGEVVSHNEAKNEIKKWLK